MSKPKHHVRQEVCLTRAPYRDGRKPTAVKVYTIHHESKFLLVQGVSATGVGNELVKLFETVGDIEDHKTLDDYPSEQFTEVHLIKYKRIQSARFAKRKFDDWSFFGGVLHVCYAPEFETVQETREKLRDRRRVVEAKAKQYRLDGTYSNSFTQTAHSSDISKDEDRSDIQPQTLSIENRDTNLGGENNHNRSVYHSEQTQKFTSNERNAQQYDVHDWQSFSSNTNQYYGGQSLTPQHNLQSDSQSGLSLQNHIESSVFGNSGNSVKAQSQTNVQHQQTSQSYGEHVVEQARSLQNYGKNAFFNRGNTLKRPNLSNSLTDDSEKVEATDSLIEKSEEQLTLPPPPKQMRYSGVSKSQKYGGARVPSAQATFPADFDARTDKADAGSATNEISDASKSYLNRNNKIAISEDETSKSTVKTMQDKVEENLKNKNVVIKEYSKKTMAPKFIPRQTQIRNKVGKAGDKNKTEKDVSKIDELSKEIRKNALTLGKVQGPVDIGPSFSKELLDPKEKSVINSTLEIRKKLKQIKD